MDPGGDPAGSANRTANRGADERALFTGGSALQREEPRSWKAFLIASAAVITVLVALILLGRHSRANSNPGGAGPAPLAAYAPSLPITDVQMSDSANLSGGKETYLDGTVTNRGGQTVRGVTVQLLFRDVANQLAGKETLPLNLIRFRQPYVDTEPIAGEPIAPGQSRPFRLIFDAAPESWNGEYPQVRVVAVELK